MADTNGDDQASLLNPMDGIESLQPGNADGVTKRAHPQDEVMPGDSAVTKAEKVERNGNGHAEGDEHAAKRLRMEQDPAQPGRIHGVAPIKKEFLVEVSRPTAAEPEHDDDAAEASGKAADQDKRSGGNKRSRDGDKSKGQNHGRTFGSSRDAIQLCKSRVLANEFEPQTCRFGDTCRFEHDIRKYLADGKREDLTTFNGLCPVWDIKGRCSAGWSCRFAGSHSKEIDHEDGRKELVQVAKEGHSVNGSNDKDDLDEEANAGVVNVVSVGDKITLRKKKFPTEKSDKYIQWLNASIKASEAANGDEQDLRATYVEPPLRASEKRRIYYGPETPVLAPLTTQGNLPYRRLCVSLGAQLTWSEMAMGMPLLQGEKSEFALIKAHESEMAAPRYTPKGIVANYDNNKDIRFGAQIAANKPWLALKTTEILTALCPHLRAIDLNCGCPIELVCRTGAGSALLDSPAKLEKTLRGMNAVSGEIPITVKIRMGTRDKQPTAEKLCQRLVIGGPEAKTVGEEPSGVAAITLHGRSKQQRYTRSADWEYIASCASLVNKLKAERADVADTVREPEARDQPATYAANDGLPYFCGNGDVLSHVDYYSDIEKAGVATCMIGRGALIKPWLFEEIEANQYLDKSASERLTYIEQFARYGLEYWGSDEIGVGTTRRFLLEWLSFSCRYVPIGLLEYLPPKLGDRPPAFRCRNELETLLSSPNYKDWIKISEMFLGPAHKDFHFQPKHKSNSYEIEAEG